MNYHYIRQARYTKGFIAPFILIIVALLLAGGAYVFTQTKPVGQTVTTNPTPTQTTPETQTTASQTADWKTYTNTQYGFTVNYPSNWVSKGYWSENGCFFYVAFGLASSVDSKPLATLRIYPSKNSLDAFVKNIAVSGNWQNTTFGGVMAKEIVTIGQGSKPFILVASVKGSQSYQLASTVFGDNIDTVEKMSSTFKFNP